ncbi:RNA polymerase I specific transcription initiation factor, RRN9 domain-containing protein [Penicillium ucsense]|uniref:RNA polymerase I specific transcription initiation factor, RRN9 domain-containing protein n=1 Tax=Penicillium ucsense TaxID=2839758 RepID=A0A8J8WHA2_9EURO|nr:RNA polymerase I specific transcription initiation factor, RRN9 domain-containing protein [Penicillium ucsense]KAF7735718.1 RNA polymerase I specific transcription initiation factor, RRN9 domain-containing protein [Penicillium ucsense]
MSSIPDNQLPSSSQYYPPQSAQPYRSIFGGPSSDVDPPPSSLPEPIRRPGASLFGGPARPGTIAQRNSASDPMEMSQADDEDDASDPAGHDHLDTRGGSHHIALPKVEGGEAEDENDEDLAAMKSSLQYLEQPNFPSSPEAIRPAQAPITYVLNRGRDLPLGVERPNRWTGPASTYRRLIADERGAYEGIIAERARDLASHLHNAHAYRTKRNTVHNRSNGARETDVGERVFPPRRWVAWPRPARYVPRPDEVTHRQLSGPDSLHMPLDLRPSYYLEESVVAVMMEHAKETFLSREYDLEEIRVPRLARGDEFDDAKHDDLKDAAEEKDEDPVPDAVPLQPTVQADDGLSRKQLRPLSRDVIGQINRLLMGLHHSVMTRFQDDDSSSESEAEAPYTDYEEMSRSRSRRVSGSRSQSRGRKRARRHSSHSDRSSRRSRSGRSSTAASARSGSARSPSRSRGRSRTSRVSADLTTTKYRLALRDWSEVVGIAAMIGLPKAAVARASQRCADLFGEDIAFRTLHEGRMVKLPPPKGAARAGDRWKYYESEPEIDEELEPNFETAPQSPAPGLSSVSSPRKRKQMSQARSRSPSQSRRHHSTSTTFAATSTAAVVAPSSHPSSDFLDQLGDSADPAGQSQALPTPKKGKGKHRKADIVCPVTRCSRNTNGFSRTWNLTLHMRRVHPNYFAGERERSRSESTPGGVEIIEID